MVDTATLDAAWGKYARACVEIDLRKPLRTSYTRKGRKWGVQYECLHLICFSCGRYGHSEVACPSKRTAKVPEENHSSRPVEAATTTDSPTQPITVPKPPFGAWMIADQGRRRSDRPTLPVGGDGQLQTTKANTASNRPTSSTTARDKGKSVFSPTAHKQTSSIGGSHFRILSEAQEMEEGESTPQTNSAKSEPTVQPPKQPNPVHFVKKKSNPMDPLSISVSSVDLAANISPINLQTNLEQKGIRVSLASQKLPSGKPLKDISNNLHMKAAHFKPNDNGTKVPLRGQDNLNDDGLDMDISCQAQSTDPKYQFTYPAHYNGPMRFGATFPTGRPPRSALFKSIT